MASWLGPIRMSANPKLKKISLGRPLAINAKATPNHKTSLVGPLMRHPASCTARACRDINRWKLREPPELDFEQERPILIPRLFDLHLNELGYKIDEMQNVLCMFAHDLVRIYELNLPKPGLRIVS